MTPEHKRHSENLTGYLKRVCNDMVCAVVAEGGDNVEAAAEALRTTGKAMGAEAPSQAKMAAWLATDAAESTRAEIASRQAAVWGEKPEDVTVTG